MQSDRNSAGRWLAGSLARLGHLDTVYHRVSQHVLERRKHLFEYLPVEFSGGTLDGEFGALACLARDVSNQPCEPRDMLFERHHAGPHQSILQLRRHPRLLDKQVLRLPGNRLQQVFEAGQVARRLGKSSRELLNHRVAVEFQGIKVLFLERSLVAMDDLRLGLDFEFA